MMRSSFVAFLLLLSGCEPQFGPTGSVLDHPNIRYDYVSELAEGIVPDSGVYYTYRFLNYPYHLDQPILLLDTLLRLGCPITAAWYQDGGRCQAEFTSFGTATIYPAVFIVRLAQADSTMEKFNFTFKGERIPYICRYRVTVFTISD